MELRMYNKGIVYKQVYDVLKTLDDSRVPEKILLNLQEIMDEKYEFDMDHEELLEESKDILSAIYTDYLATDDEKDVILKLEDSYRQKEEKVKRDKYDVDVFKNRKIEKQEEHTQIIKQKNNFIKKILKKLKKFFSLGRK